jgi:hypothetical protein
MVRQCVTNRLGLVLWCWCAVAVGLFAWTRPTVALGQGALAREAVESLTRSLAKYLGKKSTQEAIEHIAEYGGERLVREVAERVVREGGEEALERTAIQVAKHGPDLLRTLSHAPSARSVLRWLDELPVEQAPAALARLSAGSRGQVLCNLAEKYGVRAIQAELRHPGIGTALVRDLGDDGIELASRLGADDALTISRHAGDIAKLPPEQRQGVLNLLYNDTKRMVAFMGRFVEKNPGKVLFTAATTTFLLANADKILGGEDIEFDSNGNPVKTKRPGFIERTIEVLMKPFVNILLWIAGIGIGSYILIEMYFLIRRRSKQLSQIPGAPPKEKAR